MKLSELLDVELLEKHTRNRVVNAGHHPALPLTIYNYGQKAQFDNIWDDVTCKTRGLIVDKTTDEVIARPFAKFFNLQTLDRPETCFANLPATAPEVTEKLDGSLGILYRYKGFTGIATRGSFQSDQAAWASAWYNKNMPAAVWPVGWTPLFEIIYPDNRIVVKYDSAGLTLLAMVNIETGAEVAREALVHYAFLNSCPVVFQRYGKDWHNLAAENTPNAEGYVLTWPNPGTPPFKVKVKFEEYFRLHRLLTGITPKAIWENLRDGLYTTWMTDHVPEHYAVWINYWRDGLVSEFGRIEQKANAIYATCPLPKEGKDPETRKKLAAYFTAGELGKIAGVLFAMLDGKDYTPVIWKMVKEMTAGQQGFRPTNE
jgi:RNA ligase